MSGICGIVSLDGCPAEAGEIKRVIVPLQRRGPDGTRSWHEGIVALGHTLLATTPESLEEKLPLTHLQTNCTITADARLDNREELMEALELSEENLTVGDGELILLAYLKWGEACLDHLLGDFAFAIWDLRSQQLFCARDQVGMRQLIYCHKPGRLFVFATEPQAILQHPSVPKQINEGRIADFLEGLEAYDLTSTFFQNIYRLPPAHFLRLNDRGLEVRRYWKLGPRIPLILNSDEEYVEAFRLVFTQAVQCRLRGADTVGAMLSGGMDSGAIVAVASDLLQQAGGGPLKTFSAVGNSASKCKETLHTLQSTQIPGLDPHFFSLENIEKHREALMWALKNAGEPFDGHMTILRAVYLLAQSAGVKAVFDGGAGDAILAAPNHIPYLLRRGRFVQVLREARGQRRFWGSQLSLWRLLSSAAGQALVPKMLRDLRRRLGQFFEVRHADVGGRISPDFANRINLEERKNTASRIAEVAPFSSSYDLRDHLLHPWSIVALERYDRVAGMFGIEPRAPFLDLRLIQLCQSLPLNQLARDGWPKFILRQAMDGKLPDQVRWRCGKEHLGLDFTRALLGGVKLEPDQIRELSVLLVPYLSDPASFIAGLSASTYEAFVGAVETHCLSSWIIINDSNDNLNND